MKAEQQTDGTWKVGSMSFTSQEAAEMFAKSRTEAGTINPNAPPIDWTKVGFYVVGLALIAWAYTSCSGGSRDLSLTGLEKCQMLIKQSARFASVPYASDQNDGKTSEMFFAWTSSNPVTAQNGLGLTVKATASCTVDRNTLKIKAASLDGRTIM